eukprot:CAMPEP_0172328872 /NCGR_PEP_ID=MMETSP1058-20130122/60580_1 /TAXON_ID=83371 /ORGANISM="Detonula confervacea, Strain CCMP 353" /LENGTH=358 /DNA_ID=CAMNT_0013046007 /DNA_START=347 /DNA_END=1420 /DNA_ORIENTATION=+
MDISNEEEKEEIQEDPVANFPVSAVADKSCPSIMSSSPPNKPNLTIDKSWSTTAPQKIVLKRFDILKFYNIDILKHNFNCQFFLEFHLPNCAALESGTDIPAPTAKWFIKKIEPQNLSGEGAPWKPLDSISWKDGTGWSITMRIEGTFFLDLKLQDFPFDTQKIMIRMIYIKKNESEGNDRRHLCAEFELDTNYKSKLNMAGFMNPKQSWKPLGELDSDSGNVKLDCQVGAYNASGRLFPELTATLKVKRLQGHVDVVAPAGMIAGLSLMTFFFLHDDTVRLATSLSLMIAAAAYLQVVSAKVPQINYMTKLDKYALSNFVMLSAVTLVNGGIYASDAEPDGVDIVNWVLFGLLAFVW